MLPGVGREELENIVKQVYGEEGIEAGVGDRLSEYDDNDIGFEHEFKSDDIEDDLDMKE